MTPKSNKLATDISKALIKHNCTFGEIWFAFAVNLSFLLAEMPLADRAQSYADLAKRIEGMIADAKADGSKGAALPRRDH